jgi:hypothetical protein
VGKGERVESLGCQWGGGDRRNGGEEGEGRSRSGRWRGTRARARGRGEGAGAGEGGVKREGKSEMGRKGNGRNLKHDLSDAHMQEDLGGWQRRQGKPRMGKKVVWRKERVGQPLREGNSKELKIQKKKNQKKSVSG